MDWVLFILVVVWLALLSWFDLRKQEIPHSLWVIVPFCAAGIYRAAQGDWQIVLVALLVAAVSERERFAQTLAWQEAGRLLTFAPLLLLGAVLSMQVSAVAGLAILSFWAAWEWKWWGGADAVAAITVCLLWPGMPFVLSFLAMHFIVVIASGLASMVQEQKIRLHRLPGLPILLASVLILKVWFI